MIKCPCGKEPILKCNALMGWFIRCPDNHGIHGNCGHDYMVGGCGSAERAISLWNKLLTGKL